VYDSLVPFAPLLALRHAYRLAHSAIREKLKASRRSPHWEGVRDAFLKTHPTCAACGGTLHMQVHHKRPFHLDPLLELDPHNFIGLCMGKLDCHLVVGHGGSFKYYNPDVVDAAHVILTAPGQREAIEFLSKQRRKPL